jgi:hypothetical protein
VLPEPPLPKATLAAIPIRPDQWIFRHPKDSPVNRCSLPPEENGGFRKIHPTRLVLHCSCIC